MIRSPDGNTYCGRQEAVDDMRPWLQMEELTTSMRMVARIPSVGN